MLGRNRDSVRAAHDIRAVRGYRLVFWSSRNLSPPGRVTAAIRKRNVIVRSMMTGKDYVGERLGVYRP